MPRLDYRVAIPERKYAALMHIAPSIFHDLVGMLNGLRTPRVSAQQADWLARAITAASLGGQLLWQDLGLQGRGDRADPLLLRASVCAQYRGLEVETVFVHGAGQAARQAGHEGARLWAVRSVCYLFCDADGEYVLMSGR
ncbi:nitrogen fixation protein NifQ [Oxalobacteraceae bacterium]|nr:nitrogen fixation protein NifQ [Oxalobacteraceae bacterium]